MQKSSRSQPEQSNTLEARFERFVRERPEVYEAVLDRARALRDAGAVRGSIDRIFNSLREETGLGEALRLDNVYRAFFSRKIMREHPEFRGFFETRRSKADNVLPVEHRSRVEAATPPAKKLAARLEPKAKRGDAPILHDLHAYAALYRDMVSPDFRRRKNIEIRNEADRRYRRGDVLRLWEYDPITKLRSGRHTYRLVTHCLRGDPWVPKGFVAMSLMEVPESALARFLPPDTEVMPGLPLSRFKAGLCEETERRADERDDEDARAVRAAMQLS